VTAWRVDAGGITLAVRVTPRAARPSFGPGVEGQFAARVAAPPVDGAANVAVVALVAEAFGLPRRAVAIFGGDTARMKRVALTGDPAVLAQTAARLYGAGS
jgi:uncharacterized protein